ncbi:MAG: hypothetical protein ABEJ23_03480 [Haloarculaceae archaeon]
MDQVPRRILLGTLGSATLAATAGCLARARDAVTSVSTPDPGPPDYRRWLPAPASLPAEQADYDPSHLSLADLRDAGVYETATGTRNLFARSGRDYLGVDDAEIERVVKLSVQHATVLQGSFAADPVAATLDATGYEPAGEHAGYRLFARTDTDHAVGVADGVAVLSRFDRPLDVVRAVIDAGRGARPRFHEASAAFARLSDALGGATLAWLFPDATGQGPEGAVANGTSTQFAGDRAFLRLVYLFASGSDVSAADVRSSVADGFVDDPFGSLDVAVEGDRATVETARAAGAVADGTAPLQPILTLGFERDGTGDAVVVRHEGGDTARADLLQVRGAAGPTDAQFTDEHDSFGPGDALAVPASELGDPGERRLRVSWSTPSGDAASSLAVSDLDA